MFAVQLNVLAVLVSAVATITQGMQLGFLRWLGFAVTIGLSANMFSEKSLSTYVIDAGYQFVHLPMMGAIIAVWR